MLLDHLNKQCLIKDNNLMYIGAIKKIENEIYYVELSIETFNYNTEGVRKQPIRYVKIIKQYKLEDIIEIFNTTDTQDLDYRNNFNKFTK